MTGYDLPALVSFLQSGRQHYGPWSKGYWRSIKDRPAGVCACGRSTTEYWCTALVCIGRRSTFELEDVPRCRICQTRDWLAQAEACAAKPEVLDRVRESCAADAIRLRQELAVLEGAA